MKRIFALAFVALIIAFSGCTQPGNQNNNGNSGNVDLAKIVEKGDTIKVEYKGTLQDGEEFDSSAKFGNPLEFEAGAGQMIKGFDSAVIGMRLQEEKTVTLKPEEAYGYSDSKLIIEVPKEKIADFEKLKVGMSLNSPQAGTGIVQEIKSDSAIINFNHPMAGKTLTFWIKIVEITKAK